MSWRELGLDLDAWKILDLLVLEILIHQLLLQTPSGCCGSRRHGEDENLLQPHATAPCSSCRCHSPPRAVGLMMEDPPSSLHRRRRCCFCCLLPARPRQRNDWRRTWCRGMEYEYGCWFR